MRDLALMKSCSLCLIVLAAAGCAASADNNMAGNEANAAAGNQAVPVEDNAVAAANEAAPAGKAAAVPGEGYRARGSEPFWSLTIDSQMVYDSADGPDLTVATPPPRQTRAGPMYVTPEMTVRINQFRRCTEASGDERHDTVTVTIGAQTVTGCGGETTRAAE